MTVEKTAKKFPLLTADGVPVETLNEAKEAMEVLRADRRNKALPVLGAKPSLASYIETYFAKAEIAQKKRDVLLNEATRCGVGASTWVTCASIGFRRR